MGSYENLKKVEEAIAVHSAQTLVFWRISLHFFKIL